MSWDWFARLFWQPKHDPRLIAAQQACDQATGQVNHLEADIRRIARGLR